MRGVFLKERTNGEATRRDIKFGIKSDTVFLFVERMKSGRRAGEKDTRTHTHTHIHTHVLFYFSREPPGESVACHSRAHSRVPSKRELLIPLHPHLDSPALAGRQ